MRLKRFSSITLGFLVAALSVIVLLSGPASSIAAKSPAQCDAYARDYADSHSSGGGVVGETAKEAGRMLGGITGTRKPATDDWNSVYNRTYDRCMKEQ